MQTPALCPIHDCPDADISEILRGVEDPATLVELACTMAEHVSALAFDPTQTERWLQIARNWQEEPGRAWAAMRQAREEAWLEAWAPDNNCPTARADRALRATSWAMETAECATRGATEDVWKGAAQTASYATRAVEDGAMERAWQLTLFCTCPAQLEIGDRLRPSLLAS